MKQAFYMRFVAHHPGCFNHIGGEPIGVPISLPWDVEDDNYFAFVGELENDGKRLRLGSADFLQLYQPVDDSADRTPIVVLARLGGNEHFTRHVAGHPNLVPQNIEFDEIDDPDTMPDLTASLEVASLFKSKLGGIDPWAENSEASLSRRYLGQLKEESAGLNFAGMTCLLYWDIAQNRPVAELH